MGMKTCKTPGCGVKPLDQFYRDRTRPDRHQNYCKSCSDKRRMTRGHRPRPEYGRRYYFARKREALDRYGKVCVCCGEARIEFLTLDHIRQDGAEQRRKLGTRASGFGFYIWLKKNNWPEGLQVLCANCNMARGANGTCPHETERRQS